MGVNSYHHQGVKTLGKGLEVAATAPDGMVEAVYLPDHRFAGKGEENSLAILTAKSEKQFRFLEESPFLQEAWPASCKIPRMCYNSNNEAA